MRSFACAGPLDPPPVLVVLSTAMETSPLGTAFFECSDIILRYTASAFVSLDLNLEVTLSSFCIMTVLGCDRIFFRFPAETWEVLHVRARWAPPQSW